MGRARMHCNQAAKQAAYRQRRAQASHRAAAVAPALALARVPATPGHRRWQRLLQHTQAVLETVTCEMQEYYEARSEQWQEDERGAAFVTRCEALEDALEALVAALNEVTES